MTYWKTVLNGRSLAIMMLINLGITLLIVAVFYTTRISFWEFFLLNGIKTFMIGTTCYFTLQTVDFYLSKRPFTKWFTAFWATILATILGNIASNYVLSIITQQAHPVFIDDFFFQIIAMSLIFGFFIYIFFLVFHNYMEKKVENEAIKQMKTQAELNELKYRINPHFLFNTLNSIASLIHEKPDQAEKMVTDLSDLLRFSLSKNNNDLIKIAEELSIVKMYLDIEKKRFGDRLLIQYDIESDTFLFPQAILLTLVENAIKHGISNLIDGGEVQIYIRVQPQIMIEVRNDYPGKQDEMKENFGLKYVRKVLAHCYGENHKLDIVKKDNAFIVRIIVTP